MRLTLSDSLGAGHGRLCVGRSLFLMRGEQARRVEDKGKFRSDVNEYRQEWVEKASAC